MYILSIYICYIIIHITYTEHITFRNYMSRIIYSTPFIPALSDGNKATRYMNKVHKTKGQSKTGEPFKEGTLQNIEYSSKHAVFLSEKVQSSFQKIIWPSSNQTVFLSKTKHYSCNKN